MVDQPKEPTNNPLDTKRADQPLLTLETFLAVSIPLGWISIASIGAVWFSEPEVKNLMQQTETKDPITYSSSTLWFGPFSVTTNVRPWAGFCLIMGLLLTVHVSV